MRKGTLILVNHVKSVQECVCMWKKLHFHSIRRLGGTAAHGGGRWRLSCLFEYICIYVFKYTCSTLLYSAIGIYGVAM